MGGGCHLLLSVHVDVSYLDQISIFYVVAALKRECRFVGSGRRTTRRAVIIHSARNIAL